MVLALDVGNSRIKAAVFNLEKLQNYYVFTIDNALDNYKIILKDNKYITSVIISSVGKFNEKEFQSVFKNTNITTVNHQSSFPFINLYKTPTTLGIDRLVVAAGATLKYPNKNKLVIDAGTCITYDFVDSNNNYLGGAISPGINMRYKALNYYTDKLPLLTTQLPEQIIGNSTQESIHSGVINGVLLELDGIINIYLSKYKDLTIILTGGDSIFLAKSLKSTIFVSSNFLLESLNLLHTYIKRNE